MIDRFVQVLRDRGRKAAMASADYWDERARTRSGFARSVWHSETFSRAWDARQQQVLRDALGPFAGRRVADVGCGTGRISRFLADEGALVTGYDFSPATVEAARAEGTPPGLAFEIADATTGSLPCEPGTFDLALTVGCLAVACRDLASLGRSLTAMSRATASTGRVALLEPIHRGPLVPRVLRASVREWIGVAQDVGLELEHMRGMGFLPVRLLLSGVDAPSWLVDPVFRLGEEMLEGVPSVERAADYRLLVFRHRGV